MNDEIEYQSFLGTGWSFPPSFEKETGTVAMVSQEEDIRQSLQILLSTEVGERIMDPKFGCDLTKLLYEPLNVTTTTFMKELVKTAILYFEPRIELDNVLFQHNQENEGVILITVEYTIRATNTRSNYVFPFYLNEGTNILNKV